MPLEFDLRNTTVTEFGVGHDGDDGWLLARIPVDGQVQAALREMVAATWLAMQDATEDPPHYEPSEKHAGMEYLYLPRGSNLELGTRELYEAENVPPDATALDDPAEIVFYFARLLDAQGRRLLAARRASYFKGILKSHLIRVVDDSLRIVEDTIFKLDNDFDFLIDAEHTHIWRPASFESLAGMKQAVLAAVPINVAAIEHDVPFVDFTSIQTYASTHPRAARSLASIRMQMLAGMNRHALVAMCQRAGVHVEDTDGRVRVTPSNVMDFLEVLVYRALNACTIQ